MLNFLEKLPNIYIVFFAFLILSLMWTVTRDNNIFTLANTALGAVIGLAMKTNKAVTPANIVNAETVESVDNSITDDLPVFHAEKR